jgi:transcriptional regulator with XRE-family HTH domain
MKLSAIVIDYRQKTQISQREFARRCGLSNSYISFIENEYNPRTKKPITPTIEQYRKIAAGMGLSVHQLFEQLDQDSPVDLMVFNVDPSNRKPLVIPNSDLFRQIMENMSADDYVMVMDAFNRTYAKMKERGLIE